MLEKPLTILIIGSIAWDEIISLPEPLRTGTHNTGRKIEIRIGGGAANTALALVGMSPMESAGALPIVVSAVGEDAEGTRLVNALDELGVGVERIGRQGKKTTHSLVLIDQDGERTVINLARTPVSPPSDLADIPADCCYVRSADPVLQSVLAERVRHGLVIAHIPPTTEGSRPAQVLVGSASDLEEEFLADPFPAGQRIAGSFLKWVVITFGPDGAIAYGEGMSLREPAPRVPVQDTTGAGDAFAGGLAFALSRGEEMPSALKTAVRWGSESVRYYGTIPPHLR
uniref:Sugar or nucleoside kinase, ribokinase family n=1 Tax=Candidatus Kentrum sp. MB TaxID=2138164 RepID=A0A450XB55_9GAMM|nr:MAG: Sugar or nucleoside kinase, ribokinase family [Candidatus Kentron sp. MB]VFK26562.1 MAG: Sugar or nucleoside kinase, ribokinase family [Candidatus Kentron sp. MB]VFK74547.1 MAG: Sugar or nucleoside kinase, ribokinase family [Candidatus Kentron sp. MB]